MTVGAAAPLQAAGAAAMLLPESYYAELAQKYAERRDLLLTALRSAGFAAWKPRGAYYIMTDIPSFGAGNDREFATQLVRDIGVAAVPGSSFYSPPGEGAWQMRFAFCKRQETLHAAIENLRKLVR